MATYQAASKASVSPANPSTTDEPRKIVSVKRMSALLRSLSAETQVGAGISSTSALISDDIAHGDSKVATDNGKPTTPLALSASTASRVTCLTSYVVKKAVMEDSDLKYAKAVLEATNEKVRADKLESQVTELLKRARTADSDAIKLMSEHDTVVCALRTELEAKEKQVLELQEQLAIANSAAASATQEARQERDFHKRRADSSEKALDEALVDNTELKNLCRMHGAVHQWMVMLIGALTVIGIMLGVLCYCLMTVFLHPFESARGALGVALFSASILPVLWTRIVKEEAMLEKEFKDEWKVYTRRVPSRVIPGIL